MRKVLITIVAIASMTVFGCARMSVPAVHRIDIQQGNVVTQEMVNQLKPGMTKSQVQFVLGSPSVIDVFHQERWDYVYRYEPGRGETAQQHLTLLFNGDKLAKIIGDLRPLDEPAEAKPAPEPITVPPQVREPPGVLTRIKDAVTFDKDKDQP